jgi:uncharacterized membrane protein
MNDERSCVMENLIWILAGIGLMMAGLPMFLQKVPPNRWYGFRLAKTLRDPFVWYEANRVAGRDLFLAGVAVLLAAFFAAPAAWLLPGWITDHLAYGVFSVTMLLVIVDSFWALRKL